MLTYGLNVSVDGFVAAPDGNLDWSTPSAELFEWWLAQETAVDLLLYGRKMWDNMSAYWPTGDQQPHATDAHKAYARNWRDTPKLVFSSHPIKADWDSRVVMSDAIEHISALKKKSGQLLRVAGAELGGAALRAGLVDEITVVTHPVILGAGAPFLPPLPRPIPLRLVELTEFEGGITMSRYRTD